MPLAKKGTRKKVHHIEVSDEEDGTDIYNYSTSDTGKTPEIEHPSSSDSSDLEFYSFANNKKIPTYGELSRENKKKKSNLSLQKSSRAHSNIVRRTSNEEKVETVKKPVAGPSGHFRNLNRRPSLQNNSQKITHSHRQVINLISDSETEEEQDQTSTEKEHRNITSERKDKESLFEKFGVNQESERSKEREQNEVKSSFDDETTDGGNNATSSPESQGYSSGIEKRWATLKQRPPRKTSRDSDSESWSPEIGRRFKIRVPESQGSQNKTREIKDLPDDVIAETDDETQDVTVVAETDSSDTESQTPSTVSKGMVLPKTSSLHHVGAGVSTSVMPAKEEVDSSSDDGEWLIKPTQIASCQWLIEPTPNPKRGSTPSLRGTTHRRYGYGLKGNSSNTCSTNKPSTTSRKQVEMDTASNWPPARPESSSNLHDCDSSDSEEYVPSTGIFSRVKTNFDKANICSPSKRIRLSTPLANEAGQKVLTENETEYLSKKSTPDIKQKNVSVNAGPEDPFSFSDDDQLFASLLDTSTENNDVKEAARTSDGNYRMNSVNSTSFKECEGKKDGLGKRKRLNSTDVTTGGTTSMAAYHNKECEPKNKKPSDIIDPVNIKKEKDGDEYNLRANFSFTQDNDVLIIESDEDDETIFGAFSQFVIDIPKEEDEDEEVAGGEKDVNVEQEAEEVLLVDPWEPDDVVHSILGTEAPAKKELVDPNESAYLTQKALQDALNAWSDDEYLCETVVPETCTEKLDKRPKAGIDEWADMNYNDIDDDEFIKHITTIEESQQIVDSESTQPTLVSPADPQAPPPANNNSNMSEASSYVRVKYESVNLDDSKEEPMAVDLVEEVQEGNRNVIEKDQLLQIKKLPKMKSEKDPNAHRRLSKSKREEPMSIVISDDDETCEEVREEPPAKVIAKSSLDSGEINNVAKVSSKNSGQNSEGFCVSHGSKVEIDLMKKASDTVPEKVKKADVHIEPALKQHATTTQRSDQNMDNSVSKPSAIANDLTSKISLKKASEKATSLFRGIKGVPSALPGKKKPKPDSSVTIGAPIVLEPHQEKAAVGDKTVGDTKVSTHKRDHHKSRKDETDPAKKSSPSKSRHHSSSADATKKSSSSKSRHHSSHSHKDPSRSRSHSSSSRHSKKDKSKTSPSSSPKPHTSSKDHRSSSHHVTSKSDVSSKDKDKQGRDSKHSTKKVESTSSSTSKSSIPSKHEKHSSSHKTSSSRSPVDSKRDAKHSSSKSKTTAKSSSSSKTGQKSTEGVDKSDVIPPKDTVSETKRKSVSKVDPAISVSKNKPEQEPEWLSAHKAVQKVNESKEPQAKSSNVAAAAAKFQEKMKKKKLDQIMGPVKTKRSRSSRKENRGLTSMTQCIESAKENMYERVRKAREEKDRAKEAEAIRKKEAEEKALVEAKVKAAKIAELKAKEKQEQEKLEAAARAIGAGLSNKENVRSKEAAPKRDSIVTDTINDLRAALSQRDPTEIMASLGNKPEDPPVKKAKNIPQPAVHNLPDYMRGDVMNLLDDVPEMPNANVGKAFSTDDVLYVILQWLPQWLDDMGKAGDRGELPPLLAKAVPWLLPTDTLWPVPDVFDTTKEYVEIMLGHVLHESWASLFSNWKSSQMKPKASLIPIQRLPTDGERFHSFIFQGLIQSNVRPPLMEGDLVIVHLRVTKNNQPPVVHPVFGYVEETRKYRPRNQNEIHQKLGKLDNIFRNRQMAFNATVKMHYKRIAPDIEFTDIETTTCLTSDLRGVNALVSVQKNPLCRHLIQPNSPKIFAPVKKEIKNDLLALHNVSQAQAIASVADSLLQPYTFSKVSLIQGPPGTGKSHTILSIIRETIFNKTIDGMNTCLLLCAPSNAAIDELVRRISAENDIREEKRADKIRLVRIGAFNSMGEASKMYSLEVKVEEAWANKRLKMICANMPMSVKREMLDIHERLPKLKRQLATAQKNNAPAEVKALEAEIKTLEVKRSKLDQTAKKEPTFREKMQLQLEILAHAHVVCTTLNSAGSKVIAESFRMSQGQPINRNSKATRLRFTGVLIDEACQSVEVEALIPLQYGSTKLVLIGDPRQLPPTVISQQAETMKYSQSLFERLFNHFRSKGLDMVCMLDTQYRMHPEVVTFPSKFVYDGRLKTDPNVAGKRSLFPFRHYLLYDVLYGREQSDFRSCSVGNYDEVDFILAMVKFLTQHGKVKPQVIGIITPYKKQKNLLTNKLHDNDLEQVVVGTVDGFQGQEKDVIIVSCVRANSSNNKIGFVADKRRLNVALTRAKYSCYVVGHLNSLQVDENWDMLIKDARKRKCVISVRKPGEKDSVIHRSIVKQGPPRNDVSKPTVKK